MFGSPVPPLTTKYSTYICFYKILCLNLSFAFWGSISLFLYTVLRLLWGAKFVVLDVKIFSFVSLKHDLGYIWFRWGIASLTFNSVLEAYCLLFNLLMYEEKELEFFLCSNEKCSAFVTPWIYVNQVVIIQIMQQRKTEASMSVILSA